MSDVLRFEDVVFAYGPETPLVVGRGGGGASGAGGGGRSGFDLAVGAGTVTAILGPNGAGKTTLLHLAMGWLRPRGGRILLEDRSLTEWPRREMGRAVALVPQTERTPFALTVLDYVLLARAPYMATLAMPGPDDVAVARDAIEEVGLAAVAHRPVTSLSGGERQCAILARAFAQQPRLLLMDEPTSHLDLGHKSRLIELLRRCVGRGLTVLLTTHEPDVAAAVATDLVLMRGGLVQRSGALAEVFNADDLSRTYGVQVRIGYVEGRQVVAWT